MSFFTKCHRLYRTTEWCFRPRFCTVRLYWTGDDPGEWDEFCYEACHWRKIDRSTCWPGVQRATTVPRMSPLYRTFHHPVPTRLHGHERAAAMLKCCTYVLQKWKHLQLSQSTNGLYSGHARNNLYKNNSCTHSNFHSTEVCVKWVLRHSMINWNARILELHILQLVGGLLTDND